MKPVTRRSVMAGAVAAVAVVPTVGLGVEGPSELAAKIRKLKSLERENASIGGIDDDEPSDRHYARFVQPYYKTFQNVPARSAEDALAAFDYMLESDLIVSCGGGYEKVVDSLVDAIRDYLARKVAS